MSLEPIRITDFTITTVLSPSCIKELKLLVEAYNTRRAPHTDSSAALKFEFAGRMSSAVVQKFADAFPVHIHTTVVAYAGSGQYDGNAMGGTDITIVSRLSNQPWPAMEVNE